MPTPHRVVALLTPPQSTFELACAAEVFGVTRPGVPDRYTFRVCAERQGPVPTLAGYAIGAPAGLGALATADTVVIPGRQDRTTPAGPAVLRALRRAHARGARIVGICSGAFLIAEAGLLDGRRATTHWRMAAELTARHPAVLTVPDVLYVDDGWVLLCRRGASLGGPGTC